MFLSKLLVGSRCSRQIYIRSGNLCTAANVIMNDQLEVFHDTKKKEFSITLEGSPESAVLQYDMLEDNVVDLYHTGVPVAFRGKGIAKVLAKGALDYFSSNQVKMQLTCTYLQKYVKDNPNPAYLACLLEKS